MAHSPEPVVTFAVAPRGARQQSFADPVGGEGERGRVGHLGHPFEPPSCEVGDDDVFTEMELGIDEEDPPSRASATALECRAEIDVERTFDSVDAHTAFIEQGGCKTLIDALAKS